MKKAMFVTFCVLAFLAGSSTASPSGRTLNSLLMPNLNLELPAITEFLPPLDEMGFMSVDQFLAAAGLPSWQELGLPALAELIKPVGGPQGLKLPTVAQAATQASQVFSDVLESELPNNLKWIAKLHAPSWDLPRINVTAAAKRLNITVPTVLQVIKLPKIPAGLPSLEHLLGTLNLNGTDLAGSRGNTPLSLVGSVAKIPGLKLPVGMPSLDEVIKVINRANKVLSYMPKAKNLPTLDQVISVVNALDGLVGAQASG